MEGATLSGRQTSARINDVGPYLHELRQRLPQTEGASLAAKPVEGSAEKLTLV